MSYLLVALGSAIGGVARFAIGGWLQHSLDGVVPKSNAYPLPVGTLIVNVTGSFILGMLLVAIAKQPSYSDEMRWLLAIGFCGGYTTFATFSADTVALLESGATGIAAMNVVASLLLSFLATYAGFMLARSFVAR